ncbi:MAG: autotransporter-associated beta strand repeat-containing protein, partial [Loktanella sp.]|nr:autotransporter-associated beta strand repeat-containing protein [Loktanella sp.]
MADTSCTNDGTVQTCTGDLSRGLGDNFTRVTTTGQLQATAAASVSTGNGNDNSGFELLSGTATVDGGGGTFTNFDTVGSEGSGGGAGMGGVFFVNTGASLTVRNANFTNNIAKGGDGGGGGSVALSDAGFSVVDKNAPGASNFFAGFEAQVGVVEGGGFVMTGLTFGSNPPFGVLKGSTIAIQSTDNPTFGTVDTSTETGLTFAGGGLDVTQFVKSTQVFIDPDEDTIDGLNAAYVKSVDRDDSGNVLRVNISALPPAEGLNLVAGALVIGDGIPAGTTVASITSNGGLPQYAVLSTPVPGDAFAGGFNIFTPPPLTGATFTASGDSVTFAEGALSPLLEEGMTVEGSGFPPGTTITAVDQATRTVTFSNTPPTNLVTFDTIKPGSVVGSNVLFAPSPNTGLQEGDAVSGNGIPPGTTVTAINGDRIELSSNVTAKVTSVISETLQVSGAIVTTRNNVDDVRVGMVVQGTGVPAGTTVTAVNAATGTITLSNGVTGDPSRLLFVSNTAFGGAMNGRAPVLTGTQGTNGNDGIAASNNGGEGGSGQGGLSGGANLSGTGGSGGDGGDGRDGLSVNPDLIFSSTALALDIAADIAAGIAAGVPDPYPKFSLAAATGLSVASKVVQAADVTRQIIVFQTNVGSGLTGTGGDGGDGGDGGAGSEFFGGGVGGAGGEGGRAAGNVLGNGGAGAGGAGGDGGFGAGGGAAGQPGSSASASQIGTGGAGGFGGGGGSSIRANSTTIGGDGGSGFGGAIFVRSGGTLVLQGEMTFAGNQARGGSSSDAGTAGAGVGSDMFIMKGANVTISANAGKKITFEGTIADDSLASLSTASNASGDGASVTINGEGQTVFLGRNTYTGDTRLEAGRLVAQDSVGIHEDSRIVFAGLPTNDSSGALQLTSTGVPVLLSAGVFDRWVGTSSDQVMWTGSGGFAALESGLTINLGASSAGNQTLTWGQSGFVPDNSSLVLGAVDALGVVTLVNDIDTVTPATDNIAFYLIDNVASANDHSVLQGSVTANQMTVAGNDIAATMKVQNNLNVASLVVNSGTVETTGNGRITDTASVTIGASGKLIAGTVDTVGVVRNSGIYDVMAAQTVASLTNNTGAVVNQSANISSTGNVAQNGTLNVTGAQQIAVTGATNGLTGSGTINVADETDKITLSQLGSTMFSGVIAGAGAIEKTGGGTLNLTGASTFTGGTTVTAGTLDTTDGGTLADTGAITIATDGTFIAGTVDTVGAVDNTGIYTMNVAQTATSLTNNALGITNLNANLTAGAGGVTNAATGIINQDANISSTGDVAQDGTLYVTGARRIDVTGAETGLSGAGTIKVTAATDQLTLDQLGNT